MQRYSFTVGELLREVNGLTRLFGKPKARSVGSSTADPADLDRPIIKYGSYNVFTSRMAMEGIQYFGAPGAGKTSSARNFAMAFLRNDYAGLIGTVKVDEAQMWNDRAKEAGREQDIMMIEEGGQFRINILEYENSIRKGKGAGKTENIVKLVSTIAEIANPGQESGNGNEAFWKNAEKELLTNIVDALKLSDQELTFGNMQRMVADAPVDLDQVTDQDGWQQNSFCYQVLNEIAEKELNEDESHTYDLVLDYFLKFLPSSDPRTKANIVAGFTGLVQNFIRGPLRKLFSTDTTFTPEMILEQGKIAIINLPIKDYGHLGRIAQATIKLLFQNAVERRDVKQNPRLAFLWFDESHTVLSSNDFLFQTTARSSRCATVYLTQNISNYYATMKGKNPVKEADALMACFGTKIFCANNDPVTNEWAAKLIGRDWSKRGNVSARNGDKSGSGTSFGLSEDMQFQVNPIEFTRLRTGGPNNNYVVDCFLTTSGRVWSNGKNFIKVAFSQLSP